MIHQCIIDVSTAVYNSYISVEIIWDWNDIRSNEFPLDELSRLLFYTLYKYLIVKAQGLDDVNNEKQSCNKSRYQLLLSLCYWIKRC
jgi:hypothetical protein